MSCNTCGKTSKLDVEQHPAVHGTYFCFSDSLGGIILDPQASRIFARGMQAISRVLGIRKNFKGVSMEALVEKKANEDMWVPAKASSHPKCILLGSS